ncbi:hypothetical protein [Paenibacillus sp. Soil522]|uniref:hypothetical protein n=1 Tax=Paenibacillus sp. Soil522 TaxID=1736388 RepID=UPI000ABFA157|nr:hypothetical protein [Paenibacillus sp. Soil522]
MLGRLLFNLFKRSNPLLALFLLLLLLPFEFVTNLIDFDPNLIDLDQLPFDLFQILSFHKYLSSKWPSTTLSLSPRMSSRSFGTLLPELMGHASLTYVNGLSPLV